MEIYEKLDQVTTKDGEELSLYRQGDYYSIDIAGHDLMSSHTHDSEEEMAQLAYEQLRSTRAPRVLIGGLGMGYTLRSTLDILPPDATVVVAEVFERVVHWNREWLGHLAGHPLRDPRVTVEVADVGDLLEPHTFNLILLDVDNGPDALTLEANLHLYSNKGLQRLKRALKRGGVLAVWSASPDRPFLRKMQRARFTAWVETVRARKGKKGHRHTIFLATPLYY